MKVLLLTVLFTSVVHANQSAKLRVFCGDAPRGKEFYQANSVRLYKNKLYLESWNNLTGKSEVKFVLDYKDCTVQPLGSGSDQLGFNTQENLLNRVVASVELEIIKH